MGVEEGCTNITPKKGGVRLNRYKALKIGGKKFDVHRVIMYGIIGRKLLSTEVVHHKNEDKTDNTPNNLELKNLSDHSRFHMQGAKAPCAKLAETQVIEIFNSDFGCRKLAQKFNVDKKTIQKIKNGKTWAHLNLCVADELQRVANGS